MSPRAWSAWALAAGLMLSLSLSRPAQAQLVIGNAESFRSPQRFALELRLGPYSPNVDEEFDVPDGKEGPHDSYFGSDRRVMFQLEFDYQFFRKFGSAAVGASVGYFRENAKAPKVNPPDVRSEDTSRLSLYPMAVLVVYRANQLFQKFRVPLVPYAKLGVNYTIWSIYDANDEVIELTGEQAGRGRGGTRGWQAAVGLSLVMDFLDPGAARALDSETGINHTHLFFEYARFDASGLGQKNRLQVGDTTWMAGLLFEL